MEPTKFESLTKALATSASRRHALKTIAATTLGSIFGLGGIGTVFAKPKCHHAGQGCDTDSKCCTGLYCANGKCTTCPALPACNGNCPCPSGFTCVNGACVLIATCLGQTCTSDVDCCQGTFCTATLSCFNGVGVCCGGAGVYCTSDNDCCCGTPGLCDLTTNTCGCFTAGTLIAMADGTSRPIEHILEGDLVLGNAGRVNRVTAVLLPILGNRSLYSLNGSNHFVTAGHPFMTAEGWKAIDPSATPVQHSELHVGQLSIDDRLVTLTAAAVPVGGSKAISGEAVDIRIEAVTLQGLLGQAADPATQLYNLRLDGNHTYFANNLLVHNK